MRYKIADHILSVNNMEVDGEGDEYVVSTKSHTIFEFYHNYQAHGCVCGVVFYYPLEIMIMKLESW